MALRLDGKPASAKTIARKRAIFYNALEYAVQLGLLTTNPIGRTAWRGAPKSVESVDRRVVFDRRRHEDCSQRLPYSRA